MDINITSSSEQRRRVVEALRQGRQSTVSLRSLYNIMHPGARIKELREMGFLITTDRQSGIDDYGRKHRGVAVYTLLGEGEPCA